MTEDVTIETTTEDVTIENAEETKTEDTEVEASPEVESEEIAETVEQKLERVQKENTTLSKKTERQAMAYNSMRKAHENKLQEFEAMQAKISQQEPKLEPTIDDYDTHDEYVDALANFRADKLTVQKEQEFQQRQVAESQQKEAAERAVISREQEAEYLKVNPRYEASKNEFSSYVSTAGINSQVESAIVDMAFEGNVAQIIDYFGANNGERISELETIARMTPVKAAVEIYKIQQTLKTPTKQTKTIPAPVQKVKGTSKASKKLDDMDGAELLKSLGLR